VPAQNASIFSSGIFLLPPPRSDNTPFTTNEVDSSRKPKYALYISAKKGMPHSILSTDYPISDQQVSDYQKDGHILLTGVLPSAPLSAYRSDISKAVERLNGETRKLEERDTYGKAFLQTMNLWESDDAVRSFTFARRFAGIAARLMGVERVRLYHDQALYKEPGGGHTPWHQDQYYWPIDTSQTVTMWMPLVDIEPGMGMLTFATGSHTRGAATSLAISDDSEAAFQHLVEERGYPVSTTTRIKAGDATFHAGWTLHRASGNSSASMREVMTIIYMADGARVTIPSNPNQEADRLRWLSGQAPGSRIDGNLNPCLL
jgi:ectoine hydroxylase-related dioxygenase (phytanoyl-CoA dioxygenase family)